MKTITRRLKDYLYDKRIKLLGRRAFASGKGNKTLNKYIFLIVMLAIPLANFLVFWVYVNFQSILNAFRIDVRGDIIYSFANWRLFFKDLTMSGGIANLPLLLKNTLIFFFFNMLIIFPLSFLMSYFLFKKIAGYKLYRVVFFLPSIISAAVLATLYKFMLNPSLGGIVTKFYTLFTGLESPNFLMTDEHAMTAVLMYCLWTGFSVNLVLFNGAMGRIPRQIIEAAKIDGVSMTGELFRIIMPMMWATLSTMIVLNVANIFISSGPVLLLTNGAYNTSTISFWMFIVVRNQESIYYPSTVGLVFTLVALPVVLGVKRITESVYKDVQY